MTSTDPRPKSSPSPSPSRGPDRRLAALVVAFGVLVVAGGTLGAIKGSVASIAVAGPIGLGLLGSGVAMLRGLAKARVVAMGLCLATALVMGGRAAMTGKAMPGVPVGILGLALGAVLASASRGRA